jgi:hypothetical protein
MIEFMRQLEELRGGTGLAEVSREYTRQAEARLRASQLSEQNVNRCMGQYTSLRANAVAKFLNP